MERTIRRGTHESHVEDSELARNGSNLANFSFSEVKTNLQLAQCDQDVEDDLLDASLEGYQ